MDDVGGGARPVAVVGAGLTGASWAGLFAARGLEVRLHDRDVDRATAAAERARGAATFLSANGLADPVTAERGLSNLRVEVDPEEAFSGVLLVQECVTEDLAAKRAVFSLADGLVPADALIATSSSGLSISDIQEGLAGAGRCLAAHPYNPPHLVPLVELAPGLATLPETLERARRFYASMGKEPVVLRRDIPGYIANRLSAALWREAVELVRSGVATVAEVDSAVRNGPGLRWSVMGPHMLYHLGGGPRGYAGTSRTSPTSRRACSGIWLRGPRSLATPRTCWREGCWRRPPGGVSRSWPLCVIGGWWRRWRRGGRSKVDEGGDRDPADEAAATRTGRTDRDRGGEG